MTVTASPLAVVAQGSWEPNQSGLGVGAVCFCTLSAVQSGWEQARSLCSASRPIPDKTELNSMPGFFLGFTCCFSLLQSCSERGHWDPPKHLKFTCHFSICISTGVARRTRARIVPLYWGHC